MNQSLDLLRPGEIVLVSCCNVGRAGSRYSVAVLSTAGVHWLRLDEALEPGADLGVTGIAATEHGCFIAIQGERPRIVSLDRELRVIDQFTCRRARDLHSISIRDGRLYLASTGCNQILSIECRNGSLSGEERVELAAGPERDSLHLNSVCALKDGTVLYSMFGERTRGDTRSGAVLDADTGQVLQAGLLDPHSVTDLGAGRIGFCESLASRFCILDCAPGAATPAALRRVALSGYTRGCARTDRHIIVGASRWRHRSRSLGSWREAPPAADPHGNPWQRAALFFLDPDLSVAHRLDFTPYAPEIFEVVCLGSGFRAAAVFEDAAARRLDAMYEEIHGASGSRRRWYRERYRRA